MSFDFEFPSFLLHPNSRESSSTISNRINVRFFNTSLCIHYQAEETALLKLQLLSFSSDQLQDRCIFKIYQIILVKYKKNNPILPTCVCQLWSHHTPRQSVLPYIHQQIFNILGYNICKLGLSPISRIDALFIEYLEKAEIVTIQNHTVIKNIFYYYSRPIKPMSAIIDDMDSYLYVNNGSREDDSERKTTIQLIRNEMQAFCKEELHKDIVNAN